ncbi:hypothetical protein A2799_00725 [Candidatus Roizmanbacteria bacterium RIFCSPHIGHO2_01_FULL_39_24]|uniref:SpoVT-AbrB domain-containing protein n=1 Tax=Candidatus Roizmanbacteria bacterium RIFCSPHIGHO2_01_FULL_39_24 TaxID=1802032 RepID=A0A1F7GIW2_9BACT|nr:MAG: hypothetical protein A2799_00725 [Candidatus Roizmanbacteria bacterium RIFCSPHIGHO2_01_FULL_39_24]OGK49732.1 MAG: hypothetical protein A3A56_03955 [Candidatus Roizmanbacteria bacterium RIFCSPLOWO2_01_FULL_40_32]
MTNIQGTAIIRDRGQLTIPDKIREALKWSTPNSVVSLTTTSKNELIISTYKEQEQVNWPEIWARIKRSRSYKGKRGNLSRFIALDRENH